MLTVLSLFTGAGGLDLGFEAAGFATTKAVEKDKAACQTLRLNRKWNVIDRDIHDVAYEELGGADVLIAGPPCQPFSKSAYWATGDTSRLDDPRADTLEAFLGVLRSTRPRVFLLENVTGLAFKGKDEGLRLLQRRVQEINAEIGTKYSFQWEILNAADYGVPQVRERVFIVGSRDGRRFSFPEPTHFDSTKALNGSRRRGGSPWIMAWDAIGDLENEDHPELAVGGRWGELLLSIPEGRNYLYHTDRGGGLPLFGWRRRCWTFLLKLAKNRPSWTIQSQPGTSVGPFHWKNRRLSTREMCRLQTFPDSYVICGSRTAVQRQIGNAVPPLLAEALAGEIRHQLLDAPSQQAPLKLRMEKRDATPPPEPIVAAPSRYLYLVGNHPPHPGPGKGPAARRTIRKGAKTIATPYPKPSSVQVSLRMRRVRGRNTKPEVIVRKLVHAMGYRYRLHGKDLPGRPDLVFSGRRKAIFVHGCFWHRHDCRAGRINPTFNTQYWRSKLARNKRRDEENVAALQALGWTPLIIWECKLADRAALAKCIKAFLGTPARKSR